MNSAQGLEQIDLPGPVTPDMIAALHGRPIGTLRIRQSARLGIRVARELASLRSVDHLWLWCDTSRAAMRHLLATVGLRELNVLNLVGPGQLSGFSGATALEVFRGNHHLTETDVLEVATCQSLRELGLQGSILSRRSVRKLLALPDLQILDLEGSNVDDSMASLIARSDRIRSLDLGSTRVTRAGLAHIAEMRQLRSLDLWACRLAPADLELLATMPNLEYLSVGSPDGLARFDMDDLLPRLQAIPALTSIWLDGVAGASTRHAELETRFAKVRIT